MDHTEAFVLAAESKGPTENDESWPSFTSTSNQPPLPQLAQAHNILVSAKSFMSSTSHSSLRPNFFALHTIYPNPDCPIHVLVHLFLKPKRLLLCR